MFQKAFKSLIRKHHTILNDRLSSTIRIIPVKSTKNALGYVIQDRSNMKQFGIDFRDYSLFSKYINEENCEFLHLFSTCRLSNKEDTMKFLNDHSGVKFTSSEESNVYFILIIY